VVAQGYSKEVAVKISKAVCTSSQKVYQTRWAYFSEWCKGQEFEPEKASIPQVADFLVHLSVDRNASLSTIKGYRTAIAKVLFYSQQIDLSHAQVLSDLISALEHEKPKALKTFPKWDLPLVLTSLTKPPYEPLASADLKHLTYKTVFLLWLASGARRSEIHALDIKNITQMDNWKIVKLAPNPQFLAKNYNYSTGKRNFEGFLIEALKHRLGPGLEEDGTLCPVRALRYYLDRTKDQRGGSTQLFISITNRENRAVCKNTLASWVKATILHAYRECSQDILQSLKVSSHEIRALAVSTAFYGNASIDDILSAGRWASQTTFTSFYLRDVAKDLEGIYQLGPVVAAQKVISKPL